MSVARIWDGHGLQPHRVRNFKLSRDQRFVEKLAAVAGLPLNPPDKALALCVDEKSQIQARDRTQPGLPMKKGRCGTLTHDCVRHATTTLFAALNVLDGPVIVPCFERHRHEEFLKFLRQVDRDTPEGGLPDADTAAAVAVSLATLERVRQRFGEDGLAAALERKAPARPYLRRWDGIAEARLIAVACGDPPAGCARWTLRLLADRLVELGGHRIGLSRNGAPNAVDQPDQALVEASVVHRAGGQCRFWVPDGRRARSVSASLPSPASGGLPG